MSSQSATCIISEHDPLHKHKNDIIKQTFAFFIRACQANQKFRRESVSRGSRASLEAMRILCGTTTPLRTACSSQKKQAEFPFIAAVEMLDESRAVLYVHEADSSTMPPLPTWKYAKEFPLHFFNVPTLQNYSISLFSLCFSLFIYPAHRIIIQLLLCRDFLALRPMCEEKMQKCVARFDNFKIGETNRELS